ncbi:MAG TPA: AmmeMemoRadiSam system radical SAM enzyme [Thermoanaerobaculia bacterium]|nr:AmmeMemoRadiSam system radical SAM enzyme [Thermoanaerobaculia bacterium]
MMQELSRRDLLDLAARSGVALGAAGLAGPLGAAFTPAAPAAPPRREKLSELARRAPVARYWTSSAAPAAACTDCHEAAAIKGRTYVHRPAVVRCQLCAHECTILPGERGRCRTRINTGGELRTLVYGRPITEQVDPIEKKPFYHFLPGAAAFSLATSGCPLHCRFCQNWEISQAAPEAYAAVRRSASEMADRAAARRAAVVAFTYNEPTVFIEYLVDIARAARARGLRSVLVSCGFMNEAPLAEMIEVLDGIKIDLKGLSPEFYRKVTGAELAPVLRSIRQVARAGRHLEIVNLVVPTLNDAPEMLRELVRWVAGEVGPDVPLHFTRFHPDYQLLNLPPTPVATLEAAWELARAEGLRYVYVGNVPGHPGNHTHCPACGAICIERRGFFTTAVRLRDGACTACGARLAGVWS